MSFSVIGIIAIFAIVTFLYIRVWEDRRATGYWLNKREEKSCSLRGGRWEPLPFCPGNYCGDCIFTTKDAGQPCQKKSDCEGLCEIPPNDDITKAHCSSERGTSGIKELYCLKHFLDDEGKPQAYSCTW